MGFIFLGACLGFSVFQNEPYSSFRLSCMSCGPECVLCHTVPVWWPALSLHKFKSLNYCPPRSPGGPGGSSVPPAVGTVGPGQILTVISQSLKPDTSDLQKGQAQDENCQKFKRVLAAPLKDMILRTQENILLGDSFAAGTLETFQ